MARKFTRGEAADVAQFVINQGKERARVQGEWFSEVDYLCGAMAVYFALDSQQFIPASWIFAPIANKSVLSDTVSRAEVGYLTDALFRLIEALELCGMDDVSAWPHDPRLVRRAREAWERATGQTWPYPGHVAEAEDEAEPY